MLRNLQFKPSAIGLHGTIYISLTQPLCHKLRYIIIMFNETKENKPSYSYNYLTVID